MAWRLDQLAGRTQAVPSSRCWASSRGACGVGPRRRRARDNVWWASPPSRSRGRTKTIHSHGFRGLRRNAGATPGRNSARDHDQASWKVRAGLTRQWSRRPRACARASLRLLGAAHRQRSASRKTERRQPWIMASTQQEGTVGVFSRATATYDRSGPRLFAHFDQQLVDLAQTFQRHTSWTWQQGEAPCCSR
jgi:hypothetical protein